MQLGAAIAAGVGVSYGLAVYLRNRGIALAASKPATTERPLATSQVAQSPWGSDSFDTSKLPHLFVAGAAIVAGAIALTPPSGPIASLDMARGPILVTTLWVWGAYNAIGAQLSAKLGGAGEQASKIGERGLANTLEQGAPFLACLWGVAACVDAAIATSCGTIYAAFRMFYPLAYSYYGGFAMPCEAVTQPNYQIIHLFVAALLHFGLTGGSIFATLGTSFKVWCPLIFVGHILMMMFGWFFPVGGPAGALNMAWNGPKE